MFKAKQITDREVLQLEKKYAKDDHRVLIKKNELLQKQVTLYKEKEKTLKKQLDQYRKVVFKSADKDLHSILEMQHSKIVQLQTNLEIQQSKYEKLLSNTGSNKQTQYAIKCKQLEKRLKESEADYQKQIALLKSKMVKMNASEIYENSQRQSTPGNTISPITRGKKFV